MPVFSITKSGEEVGTFVTEADDISVGRSENSTIRIKMKSVSRKHAVIKKVGLSYHIITVAQKTGCF